MNLLKGILIFLIVNVSQSLKMSTEGKSMTELESSLGSVSALTTKLQSSLDLTNKISEESFNMNEQKNKIRATLKYKDTYLPEESLVVSFNGLIIINGKVTLNVNTGYEYPATLGQEKDIL